MDNVSPAVITQDLDFLNLQQTVEIIRFSGRYVFVKCLAWNELIVWHYEKKMYIEQ